MLLMTLAFAQPQSLIAEMSSGLYRDPIDMALEPAVLGQVTETNVLGTLATRSPGPALGTVRPWGPGTLAVWVEGAGLRATQDDANTLEGETAGTFNGAAVSGGQLWLAYGTGRFGLAMGSQVAYVGQTAVAQFYGSPTLSTAPYDSDTDPGLYSDFFFQHDVVLGIGLGDSNQSTELDLLYRYELDRPYVQASLTQANARFETKGLWEPASLLENRMGHSGGVRLDSTVPLEEGELRILVEARVGVYEPASDSLIDIGEVDGDTVYRRDMELQGARLLTGQGTGLVARHHQLQHLELRYGVAFGMWTGTGGWTRSEVIYQGEQTTTVEEEHLGRWTALGLTLPAMVLVPLGDRVGLVLAGTAGWGSVSSDESYQVTGGDGERTTSSAMSTVHTGVVGLRLEPSESVRVDLATSTLQDLQMSAVWRF